jgi:uncharacterized membrane protein YoaT (DUF817 family)
MGSFQGIKEGGEGCHVGSTNDIQMMLLVINKMAESNNFSTIFHVLNMHLHVFKSSRNEWKN